MQMDDEKMPEMEGYWINAHLKIDVRQFLYGKHNYKLIVTVNIDTRHSF